MFRAGGPQSHVARSGQLSTPNVDLISLPMLGGQSENKIGSMLKIRSSFRKIAGASGKWAQHFESSCDFVTESISNSDC